MLFFDKNRNPVSVNQMGPQHEYTGNEKLMSPRSGTPGNAANSFRLEAGYHYYFPELSTGTLAEDTSNRLRQLANSLFSGSELNLVTSPGSPMFYGTLSQFIDHDISANAMSFGILSSGQYKGGLPVGQQQFASLGKNLRSRPLELNSIYGDKPFQGKTAVQFRKLLRDPQDQSKLRLRRIVESECSPIRIASESFVDLPRLGSILNETDGLEHKIQLHDLSVELRAILLDADGLPNVHCAIIADGRNDDTVYLSQLHVAFLQFHNRIVETTEANRAESCSPETLFQQAGRQAVFNYQWLIVNDFLKQVCCETVLDFVLEHEAPLYQEFYQKHGKTSSGNLPVPVEFSFAAIKTDILFWRSKYMRNKLKPQAPKSWNWYDQMEGPENKLQNFEAGRIDRSVVPTPINQAAKILDDGYLLNLPSAQECIAGIFAITGFAIDPLTTQDISDGPDRNVIIRAGYHTFMVLHRKRV